MFLQSIGLIPDNLIVLSNDRANQEKGIENKLVSNQGINMPNLKQAIKESVDQYELNIQAVKHIFKGFYSEINASNMEEVPIIEELTVLIHI